MIKERSIVLLHYSLHHNLWYFRVYTGLYVLQKTQMLLADVAGTSGEWLCYSQFITCGIYGFYWAYKCGEKV